MLFPCTDMSAATAAGCGLRGAAAVGAWIMLCSRMVLEKEGGLIGGQGALQAHGALLGTSNAPHCRPRGHMWNSPN